MRQASLSVSPMGEPLHLADLKPPMFKGEWICPRSLRDYRRQFEHHRVIILSGLAGSGKTRFMAEQVPSLLSKMAICCWLHLNRFSYSSEQLARDICTVFVRSFLGEQSASAALLMSGQGVPASTIMSVALNEIGVFAGDVTLFLDDIHKVEDPAAVQILDQLIHQSPANLRIIFAGRYLPSIRTAGYEIQGGLLRLDSSAFELAFEEIPEFVTGLGFARPDAAEVRLLLERTQGWATGLRLICHGSKPRGQKLVTGSPLGGGDLIERYCDEELLQELTSEERVVLARILVAHRLNQRLLLELCPHPEAGTYLAKFQRLGLIRRVNLGSGIHYKAVPVIVEIVREMGMLSPSDERALHQFCSGWFEVQEDLPAAASHAIAAGDDDRALDLIERCGMSMIANGQVSDLQQWLTRLPTAKLVNRPSALLIVSWALSLLYRLDEGSALVDAAELNLAQQDVTDRMPMLKSLSALRAMQMSMRDRFEEAGHAARNWIATYSDQDGWEGQVIQNSLAFSLAHAGRFESARMSLERAISPDFTARNPYAAVYSRCILGLIELRAGHVRLAENHFARALRTAEATSTPHSTGVVMAAGLLAGAKHERNDLAGARQLLDSYSTDMQDHLFTDARFCAYRALAADCRKNRQYRAAMSALDRITTVAPAVRHQRIEADVLAEKLKIALEQHDHKMAQSYLLAIQDIASNLTESDPYLSRHLEATVLSSQARLDLANSAYEQVFDNIRRAISLDLSNGARLRAFRSAIVLVRARLRSGQKVAATRLLGRLVSWAAPEGIVQPFLDGGPDIVPLLLVLENVPQIAGHRRRLRLVRQLNEAFNPGRSIPREVVAPSSGSKEILTARELQLIALVRAGLTNRQIAQRMQVSENTIKWHLKNIFEKASVSKRSELAAITI